MVFNESRKAAEDFVKEREGKGDEIQDTGKFWIELLINIFGISNFNDFIDFEKKVKLPGTKTNKRIDGYIKSTKVLIEQKSYTKDLNKKEDQSDGISLTPYEQAKRYADNLKISEKPRWIITCNFQEFHIHDMDKDKPRENPEIINLKELPKEYHRLEFLIDKENDAIRKEKVLSIKAGEIVGNLYDALAPLYADIENEHSKKSLNKLCVRIVFCLYAEDADVFGKKNLFHDYLKAYKTEDIRGALIELFKVLDTKKEDRSPYLKDDLKAFPYVNGGLFADEDIEIPMFNEEAREILISEASEDFDWSGISPTIFGALFESTLNPETKSSGGMFYTSIENIHKVIDPLFLNDLKRELEDVKNEIDSKAKLSTKMDIAGKFQKRLANLTFLDPACGSGNFLTETYLSLRRLENELIRYVGGKQLNILTPIAVQINQFYGIEINDFAVSVARTALWIAESQMMNETESILGKTLDFLPLKNNANIVEGNALRIDRNDVIPKTKLKFIIGNPPFVGSSNKDASDQQKLDMSELFKGVKGAGKLDYVCGRYKKSALYIQGTPISVAFVSTDSITQGEQVALLWKDLFDNYNIEIIFAHHPFKWENGAKNTAKVMCVIVGFSIKGKKVQKLIFSGNLVNEVDYINGYLKSDGDVYVKSRQKQPLVSGIPPMIQGNKPWDGGYLILSEEEAKELIHKYPASQEFIKIFYGGSEIIHGTKRFCLRLCGVSPAKYANIPEISKRLAGVRKVRMQCHTAAVQKQADTPMLFSQIRQPKVDYIAIPEVSSGARKYLIATFLTKDDISSNKVFMIPGGSKLLFGILISKVYMARIRYFTGKRGTGVSHSPAVYNNFPWIKITLKQQSKIEKTAEKVLEIREKFPDCTLDILYKQDYMPSELGLAHEENDNAVMQAYGLNQKMSDEEIVKKLMKLYKKSTN